uniref:DNA polymerase alpha subunit B N-terminal domain-containing protein n=1 Tax=Glossina brevipalpis TaxID=37001 RepID=A0A1A9WU76_9MUSC
MESELRKQFEEMSIEPTETVLGKAVELCVIYNVEDASEFVEQWLAFSVSNLHGDEPTIENLHEFERKVLQTKREKNLLSANKKKTTKYSSNIANLKNATSAPSTSLSLYGIADEDNMIEQYMHELPDINNATSSEASAIYQTPKMIVAAAAITEAQQHQKHQMCQLQAL